MKKVSRFALIFSMSHIAGDGYTYYRVLNMLSTSGKISSLNPVRKTHAMAEMMRAMGKDVWRFLRSPTHGLNAFSGMILGKKARAFAYYVDAAKVNRLKADAKAEGRVDFISTNDILTAGFSNLAGARIAMMAINFRNKLPGIGDVDAGNYEGVVFFDDKGYSDPVAVRRRLLAGPPYAGLSRPLPGLFEGVSCRLGLITDWARFAEELVFEGCKASLHLPLYDLRLLPYEVAVIFRPKPEKLGILFATRRFGHAQLASGNLPIDGLVSTEIFH
jgi:hypothetical protein